MGPVENLGGGPGLPIRRCPKCGKRLADAGIGPIAAPNGWTDCLRRCKRCWVGFSNNPDNPTILFGKPTDNIPEEVRSGTMETLNEALNVVNRNNKKKKFGYSTSEDAITWTVFRFLHESGQLLDALRGVDLPIPEAVVHPKALLLWGVPVPFDPLAHGGGLSLRSELEAISTQFNEGALHRTEPDVVIDLGEHGLIIIEVKHGAGIQDQADHPNWDNYLPLNDAPPHVVAMQAAGCYELTRNWVFGLGLTAQPRRRFTLVCLGGGALFWGQSGERLAAFAASAQAWGEADRADQNEPWFQSLRWNDFLEAVDEPAPWFMESVRSKGYPY